MSLKNKEKYVSIIAVKKLRKILIFKQILSWTGHLLSSLQFG